MKKSNVLNLIRRHYEGNENLFKEEALTISAYFKKNGDNQFAEAIDTLIAGKKVAIPSDVSELSNLKRVDSRDVEHVCFSKEILNDLTGIQNAINRNTGFNKFLFYGQEGTGKKEAAKSVARLLNRIMIRIDLDGLIVDSIDKTNSNIENLFLEISNFCQSKKIIILFDSIDEFIIYRNNNDLNRSKKVLASILKRLNEISLLYKQTVIIGCTNRYCEFDNSIKDQFDATIDFDRYSKQDLIDIGINYLSNIINDFKGLDQDITTIKKIFNSADELPYPYQLKNIIKTSLAFSSPDSKNEYIKILYSKLVCNVDAKDIKQLHDEGFTVREIEKIKGLSKSSVSRYLNKNKT